MAWNPMPRQQQRGSQLGEAPSEAVKDRAAQKNDEADQQVGGAPARGPYPAETLEQHGQDITPSEREPAVSWDQVVQPEPAEDDDEPLPEGK